jgi:hypothetical protein
MMISAKTKLRLAVLLGLIAIAMGSGFVAHAQTKLPNPVLVFVGTEFYQASGKAFEVPIRGPQSWAYPTPVCRCPGVGRATNTNPRTGSTYDMRGKRLYGFCALKSIATSGVFGSG